MTKLAIFAAAAFVVAGTPAFAALGGNGIQVNGVHLNGIQVNGIHLNGVHLNGTRINGVHLNGIKANGSHANGLGFGAVDGMKVMDLELSR